jgi:hypothetical protein
MSTESAAMAWLIMMQYARGFEEDSATAVVGEDREAYAFYSARARFLDGLIRARLAQPVLQ